MATAESGSRRGWYSVGLALASAVLLLLLLILFLPWDVWWAVELGNTWRVRAALKLDPSLVTARDSHGDTLLHDAAGLGRYGLVRLLLDAGADVNARGEFERTPLHAAAHSHRTDVVRLLIERGADVNAKSQLGTPLHQAVDCDYRQEVSLLLAAGADPNIQDQDGRTPLHHAVRWGNRPVVRQLLEAGANPDIADNLVEETPLQSAADAGEARIAKLLLENGAEPNAGTSGGFTALDTAVAKGHDETAMVLREAGLEDNILAAAASGNLRLVQTFLSRDPSLAQYRGPYAVTPLHVAARGGHTKVAELLLEHGAQVNARDMIHGTPLDLAAGHSEVSALLRKYGALPASQLDSGEAR